MNNQEKKVLEIVNFNVNLLLELKYDREYIVTYLNNVLYALNEYYSDELFLALFKIQDDIEIINEF